MITLRYHQAEVTPACAKYFKEKPGKNPIIALPTGSGKSYAIADLVKYAREKLGWKVLVLSHTKEIVDQDHKSIERYTGFECGIYSAGWDRKELRDVTVAGIQSIYKHYESCRDYELVIVDEAHGVNPEEGTMYETFLTGIGRHTCVGFTATPFRLGLGYIYSSSSDTLFDDKIVDWCTLDKFNKLVKDGYLCKLTTKRTELEMDTTGIKLVGGDFNEKQLADRFDKIHVTNAAIKEILAAGVNRKRWLIFAIDIDHAEHIAEILIRNGIKTAPVHSKMSEYGFDRDKVLEQFDGDTYQCVVNVNVLTTGFDNTGIDLIAVLRPTSSPGLHVQMNGRGSRIDPNKEDCLILDFAGNTKRLGPINDVVVVKKKKGGAGGVPITKECPKCKSILHPSVRFCPDCGHKFEFQHGLNRQAANLEIVESGKAAWLVVANTTYEANRKIGVPSTLKVTYDCIGIKVVEHICIEHKGFAKDKADHWVKFRGGKPCRTLNDLMEQVDDLKRPKRILAQRKGKYHNILDSNF